MPRRLRFYYWLFRGLVKRHKISFSLLFIGSIIVFLTWQIIWNNILLQQTKKFFSKVDRQYYTEGVIGIPKIINPLFATSDVEKDINGLVFQGLFSLNSSGETKPDLAEKYLLDGNKTYTVTLKRNVFWHDGVPFNANDVVYTVKTAQDPQYNSVVYDSLKDVTIEKMDDYTVRFTLKEPFTPFPSTLTFGIIPEHIPLSAYRPVGTGFFKIKQKDNKKIVLTKGWFDLTLKFYPDYDSALTGLKLGEVQGLGGVSTEDSEQFKNWPNFKMYSQPMYRRVVAIFFNVKSNLLGEKNLRSALRYAVPKDKIFKDVTNSAGSKANGPIQPTSWAAKDMKDYEYNLSSAASLLEKSGWEKNALHWEKDGTELNVKLSYPQSPVIFESAQLIAASWRELGVVVEEKIYDPQVFKDQVVTPKNFEALISYQEINPDPDPYVFWHSTQVNSGNISGFSSPKVDKILEDARKLVSNSERKEKYSDFQKYINDENPAIFLFFPPYNYIVSSRVKELKLVDFNVPSNRFNTSLDWRIEKRFF